MIIVHYVMLILHNVMMIFHNVMMVLQCVMMVVHCVMMILYHHDRGNFSLYGIGADLEFFKRRGAKKEGDCR